MRSRGRTRPKHPICGKSHRRARHAWGRACAEQVCVEQIWPFLRRMGAPELHAISARNSLTRVKGVAAAEYLVRSSSQGERACWAYLYAMC